MVTMKTVAEHAGVSRATVSYVLNGRQQEKGSRVNPETVLKVEAMAARLGYRRNEIARSVRTGKTNVLGFIGAMGTSYAMDIINGIAKSCAAGNYLLKLFQLDEETDIGMIARQCIEQRLSGVICRSLTEHDLDILHQELQAFDLPIVLVDNSFSHNWCSRVISDDIAGAQLAVEYLLKLGHRKIVNISNSLENGFSFMRNSGYRRALSNAGIANNNKLTCIVPQIYEVTESFIATIRQLLTEQQPTALFCNSDPIAMKALKVVANMGLRIPEDISIIGYAGLSYTQLTNPALTTVEQPFIDMGMEAAEILISEVTDKTQIQEIRLPVELIVRESTAIINNSVFVSAESNEVEYAM
ncbi:MAG: LacI family transcriptional regulator [Victivallaceae bacterium]|nr:LacI family transcriptional regulator [Victivallaceae bacterium]